MSNPNSKIFDEYLKLAEKEGLVSEADYASARRGHDTTDVIEMLYGVKPNDKKEDIYEDAHPETAVAAPAHDAMNGIVENLRERQDIMAHIALKTPSGDLTMHRYVKASEELTGSLVRAAFALDSANQEDLMKLADDCAGTISMRKQALGPLAIAGIAAAITLLGGIALVNNTDNMVQSVGVNAEAVLRELEDLRDEHPQAVRELANHLRDLIQANKDYYQAMDTIAATSVEIATADDLLTVAASGKANTELQILSKYRETLAKWSNKIIPNFISQIQNLENADESYQYDWLAKLRWVGEMFVPTDYKDVLNALGSDSSGGLWGATTKALATIDKALSQAQSAAPDIGQAIRRNKSIMQDLQERYAPEA